MLIEFFLHRLHVVCYGPAVGGDCDDADDDCVAGGDVVSVVDMVKNNSRGSLRKAHHIVAYYSLYCFVDVSFNSMVSLEKYHHRDCSCSIWCT